MTGTGIGTAAESLPLSTADGVALAALHVPPDAGTDRRTAVVMAPGFSGWSEKPGFAEVAAELHRRAPGLGFLIVDLRGHGRSGGTTTLGDREVLDVDAAVAAARELGYRRVVTVGWSMGGTCVLRHAALMGEQLYGCLVTAAPDAVVTVSAVSRWEVRESVAMRRLHRIVKTRLGRMVARRVYAVRVDPRGWSAPPLDPTEAAARTRGPLLVVHGEKDHYFGWEHARRLAAAADGRATLWLVPGLGHAEQAAVAPGAPPLLARLADALVALGDGRPVPPWPDVEALDDVLAGEQGR
jgi:pimeloyl-ACP methyl ester carboxylesterase